MRDTDRSTEIEESGPGLDRRQIVTAGLAATGLAAVGPGLLAGTAEAFPRGADNDFKRATRILMPYGLSVDGTFDAALGHDVLSVDTMPLTDTQYDYAYNDLNAAGGILPCWLTSSFQNRTGFTFFDVNTAGGPTPCIEAVVEAPILGDGSPPLIIFERFDVNTAGIIVPDTKTTVRAPLTTFEVLDVDAAGGVNPCWTVGVERLRDGSPQIRVTVNDPNGDFAVMIGSRTWRLVDGALVEDAAA